MNIEKFLDLGYYAFGLVLAALLGFVCGVGVCASLLLGQR